ncbi:ABC transporter substrate-binding protein [Streptococcus acidominimus]|uniref:Extracellular solute-binding protein n=1 Tax=Streptococcus acidominimus TaxID=1326 RepID=A0A4Y9FNV8_STRAI|nr:ABC transporter substrate-binding protein [Streptococcus acidominimus]MBF0819207.1 extracellular solute-binding protein [Streptococcus acidominimus]MBF0837830.1 extracellular solute-binding protein [Streptococcus acidominimus]MBF0847965.1 extracellular solute-binding protein [Streptococcus danieliae]TFU30213.1 extracellular solute-binding protein [Streptococcus acidominimus]
MKKWQKVVALSASAAALAGLAACGSLKGDNSKSAMTDDGKTVIKMYQIGDAPDNLDVLLEQANKIIGEKADAKLEIQYLGWGEYSDKMNVIVNSGENYDIAFASNYVLNAQKGAYADLTEIYQKEGKELYDSLDPAYIKGNTVDGKIYAVPVSANVTSAQHFAFNGPLVEKYGVDISNVKTLEDLEPALKVIKEKAPETVPFAIGKNYSVSSNFDFPISTEYPFVIDLDGDTKKIMLSYDVESYRAKLRTMHKYYQAGYIPQDVATSDTTYNFSDDTWFVREETVGPADYGDSLLTRVAGRDIKIRQYTDFYKKNPTTQVANFVISSTSKNKEKAMKVLTLLNTDKELLNGLVYGPEGVNWEKVAGSENRVKVLPPYNEGNSHMSGWNTGNNWNIYINENVTDEQVAEAKKILAEAKESPALGFNFNPEPVKAELSAVSNTLKQYAPAINTGTVDPDVEIPKLMEKLKSEGAYEKVLKELQKQYDEFLSAKK